MDLSSLLGLAQREPTDAETELVLSCLSDEDLDSITSVTIPELDLSGFEDLEAVTASIGFSAGQLSITPIASITRAHNDVNSNVTFWGGISIGFIPAK